MGLFLSGCGVVVFVVFVVLIDRGGFGYSCVI